MALGRARLRRDRQQHQRCRQRDDKHSHDLAPFSPNQPSSNSKAAIAEKVILACGAVLRRPFLLNVSTEQHGPDICAIQRRVGCLSLSRPLTLTFTPTCPEILKSGSESGDRANARQAHFQSGRGRFQPCDERVGICAGSAACSRTRL
jgi:hypothetical protein